jgi:hypothetical protein
MIRTVLRQLAVHINESLVSSGTERFYIGDQIFAGDSASHIITSLSGDGDVGVVTVALPVVDARLVSPMVRLTTVSIQCCPPEQTETPYNVEPFSSQPCEYTLTQHLPINADRQPV